VKSAMKDYSKHKHAGKRAMRVINQMLARENATNIIVCLLERQKILIVDAITILVVDRKSIHTSIFGCRYQFKDG